MPQQVLGLDQVFFTQKLVAANPFHVPIYIVHEHMGLGSTALLASRQDSGGEYGRHPTRRPREVPSRAVHEDHVPIYLVEVVGKVVDAEFTVGEEEVLHGTALVPELLPRRLNQLRHFADLGGVLHVVRLYVGVFLFELGDVELALVQEDGPAVAVQSFPQQGLVGQPENKEVAGRRAAPENAGDGRHLGGGHVAGDVRLGGVVKERFHGGVGQGGVPGRCGGGRGGSGHGGVDHSEDESQSEEGNEKEKQETMGSAALLVNGRVEDDELGVAIALHLSVPGAEEPECSGSVLSLSEFSGDFEFSRESQGGWIIQMPVFIHPPE